jgi:methyl-accepting chemotaxis protein
MYIALQLPLGGIQKIMGIREGMGETGESYLVGEDLKMRSNSFLDPIGHTVKASFAGTVNKNGVDTEAAKRALAMERNTDIILDYNGNPVLSSFDFIDFGHFKWAVLSEIDEPEAFASIKNNITFMIIVDDHCCSCCIYRLICC